MSNDTASIRKELLEIAEKMQRLAARFERSEYQQPLAAWQQAAKDVGRAWSGSWLGYHANVYYLGLSPPPPGARFSLERGLRSQSAAFGGTVGDWVEVDPVQVTKAIREKAGNPNLDQLNLLYEESARAFASEKMSAISLLEILLTDSDDDFIKRLKRQIDSLKIKSLDKEIRRRRPSGDFVSRDSIAMGQGIILPQHIAALCQVEVIGHLFSLVESLEAVTRHGASHILRLHGSHESVPMETPGPKLFVGHGRSPDWLELEKFIRERLKLEVECFETISTAGKSTKERLAEMMTEASFAFLVMTGEDEQADGDYHPRMNVVHEAGLFQGRLGFERAIILLEEGCEEFSNIVGLGQIRFPKGNITAKSEDIRKVLEREGILDGH
ncbi:MAG: hypothetical protein F4X83_11935 [Chloroflexi bacterium]|nr:hypothetical protein [Chloroflexota bacterium]